MNSHYIEQIDKDNNVPNILEKYSNYKLIDLHNLKYGLTIISPNITKDLGKNQEYTIDFLVAATELIDFKGYICTYGIEKNIGVLGNIKHFFYIYKHDTLSFRKLLDSKLKDNKIVFYVKRKYYNNEKTYESMLKKYCVNNGYINHSFKKKYYPSFTKYIVTLS